MEESLIINNLARKLHRIDPSNYILQNPDKLKPEILKQVVKEYQFLSKLSTKLPQWAEIPNLLGADLKAIEQCSTPITAQFKFKDFQVNSSVDLTGGYGVDSYFLSKISKKHVYNELNKDLADIVAHNFTALACTNIATSNMRAEEYIFNLNSKVELMYIDPDRRGDQKQKLVRIKDCVPNLLKIQDLIFEKTDVLIIKYSPMLDYHLALTQLKFVYKVAIISVKNDVKELIFYANKNRVNNITKVVTINYTEKEPEVFEGTLNNTRTIDIPYSPILNYVYEPNSAVMKSGLWSEIAEQYKVFKLAPNSHFYTSSSLIEDFPGRKLKVKETKIFSKKNTKNLIGVNANVISRNFGLKPDELRQKLKIKEGVNEFIIFTRDFSGIRIVISTTKINT